MPHKEHSVFQAPTFEGGALRTELPLHACERKQAWPKATRQPSKLEKPDFRAEWEKSSELPKPNLVGHGIRVAYPSRLVLYYAMQSHAAKLLLCNGFTVVDAKSLNVYDSKRQALKVL